MGVGNRALGRFEEPAYNTPCLNGVFEERSRGLLVFKRVGTVCSVSTQEPRSGMTLGVSVEMSEKALSYSGSTLWFTESARKVEDIRQGFAGGRTVMHHLVISIVYCRTSSSQRNPLPVRGSFASFD
jgi:hypothetical protein